MKDIYLKKILIERGGETLYKQIINFINNITLKLYSDIIKYEKKEYDDNYQAYITFLRQTDSTVDDIKKNFNAFSHIIPENYVSFFNKVMKNLDNTNFNDSNLIIKNTIDNIHENYPSVNSLNELLNKDISQLTNSIENNKIKKEVKYVNLLYAHIQSLTNLDKYKEKNKLYKIFLGEPIEDTYEYKSWIKLTDIDVIKLTNKITKKVGSTFKTIDADGQEICIWDSNEKGYEDESKMDSYDKIFIIKKIINTKEIYLCAIDKLIRNPEINRFFYNTYKNRLETNKNTFNSLYTIEDTNVIDEDLYYIKFLKYKTDIIKLRETPYFSILFYENDILSEEDTKIFIDSYEKNLKLFYKKYFNPYYLENYDGYETLVVNNLLTITIINFISHKFIKFIQKDYDVFQTNNILLSFNLDKLIDIPFNLKKKIAQNVQKLKHNVEDFENSLKFIFKEIFELNFNNLKKIYLKKYLKVDVHGNFSHNKDSFYHEGLTLKLFKLNFDDDKDDINDNNIFNYSLLEDDKKLLWGSENLTTKKKLRESLFDNRMTEEDTNILFLDSNYKKTLASVQINNLSLHFLIDLINSSSNKYKEIVYSREISLDGIKYNICELLLLHYFCEMMKSKLHDMKNINTLDTFLYDNRIMVRDYGINYKKYLEKYKTVYKLTTKSKEDINKLFAKYNEQVDNSSLLENDVYIVAIFNEFFSNLSLFDDSYPKHYDIHITEQYLSINDRKKYNDLTDLKKKRKMIYDFIVNNYIIFPYDKLFYTNESDIDIKNLWKNYYDENMNTFETITKVRFKLMQSDTFLEYKMWNRLFDETYDLSYVNKYVADIKTINKNLKIKLHEQSFNAIIKKIFANNENIEQLLIAINNFKTYMQGTSLNSLKSKISDVISFIIKNISDFSIKTIDLINDHITVNKEFENFRLNYGSFLSKNNANYEHFEKILKEYMPLYVNILNSEDNSLISEIEDRSHQLRDLVFLTNMFPKYDVYLRDYDRLEPNAYLNILDIRNVTNKSLMIISYKESSDAVLNRNRMSVPFKFDNGDTIKNVDRISIPFKLKHHKGD